MEKSKNKISLEAISKDHTLISLLKHTFKWLVPVYGDLWMIDGLRSGEEKRLNKEVFVILTSIKYISYGAIGYLSGMKLYQSGAFDYVKKLIVE